MKPRVQWDREFRVLVRAAAAVLTALGAAWLVLSFVLLGPTAGITDTVLVRTSAGVALAFEGDNTWQNAVREVGPLTFVHGPRGAVASVNCMTPGLDGRPLQGSRDWRVLVMNGQVRVLHVQETDEQVLPMGGC